MKRRPASLISLDMKPHPLLLLAAAAALLALFAGCAGVPVAQQRLVSRPGMVFSDSPVLASRGALAGQLEPGRAAGGAQAAGCTACR